MKAIKDSIIEVAVNLRNGRYKWWVIRGYQNGIGTISSAKDFKTYAKAVENFQKFAQLNDVTNYKIT